MPERFRYLMKEAPDKPVRWPWFIALAFLLYAWRTVLWELGNWKKAVGAVFRFLGYISKFAVAVVYYFVGDQITAVIRFIESTIYSIRAFYSDYVSSALPAAAALAAVGEPWVRLVVMVSYAALAVLQHSKMPLNKSEGETTGAVRKVPFPLICAALAIGVELLQKNGLVIGI
ncbi:hypothetical protein HAX54_005332 [Datura stramonium]|uniref:Yip1 domain-containing protein n=1 Tax=Datura stramonium TaxID=4076 RepID=A0ABS8T8I5_DATST|nr:hypothetical protein [Datura stramonium]